MQQLVRLTENESDAYFGSPFKEPLITDGELVSEVPFEGEVICDAAGLTINGKVCFVAVLDYMFSKPKVVIDKKVLEFDDFDTAIIQYNIYESYYSNPSDL